MTMRTFRHHDLTMLSDALDIAEDATGNYYKFSLSEWKRRRYDVKTLSSLKNDEISRHAFALLNKTSRVIKGRNSGPWRHDLFLICIQDHHILKALRRDKNLEFLSLLVYIFTHELVHIVRFYNFLKRFEVSGNERDKEEQVVHATTFEILKNLSISNLDYILDVYKGYRMDDMVVS